MQRKFSPVQLRLVMRCPVWMVRCLAMHPMEFQDLTFVQDHDRCMVRMRWGRMS